MKMIVETLCNEEYLHQIECGCYTIKMTINHKALC